MGSEGWGAAVPLPLDTDGGHQQEDTQASQLRRGDPNCPGAQGCDWPVVPATGGDAWRGSRDPLGVSGARGI